MKNIHFFGCSHTAGHELPDDDLLPWKKDCKTNTEYYTRLSSTKPGHGLPCSLTEYVRLCKSMAYPSIIESIQPSWKCTNHAEFGSSIRHEIFKAMTLIESTIEPIDFLVFQIPHASREFAVTNDEKLKSFLINFPLVNSPEFNAYLEKSVMFHSINHWEFQARLDLVLFEGYLLSKNIKFLFLDVEGAYTHSVIELNTKLWPVRSPAVYNLQVFPARLLLGHHFDLSSHNIFAKVVAKKIKETIQDNFTQ